MEWVQLNVEQARMHPLYGVRGWFLFLLISVGIGIGFSSFLTVIVFALVDVSDERWLLALVVIGVLANLLLVWLALRPSRYFRICAVVLLGSAFLSGAFLPVFWAIYVIRSRRVRVTTERKVRRDDPFLQQIVVPSESGNPLRDVGRTSNATAWKQEHGNASQNSYENAMNQPADLTWLWQEFSKQKHSQNQKALFSDLMWKLGERRRKHTRGRGKEITHGEVLSLLRYRGFLFPLPEPPQPDTHRDEPEVDAGEGMDTEPNAGQADEESGMEPMPEERANAAASRLRSVRELLEEGLITEEEAAKKRQQILDEI